MRTTLFPFADYWWFYLAFSLVVVVLLAIDLTAHRRDHTVSFREAGLWTALWMALALAFSFGLYLFASARLGDATARRVTLEFLTGYVVEESLSIDNMFVFALLFRYFGTPAEYQRRVLFYGVVGAVVLRGIFIAAGSALIQFHWVLVAFGVFLIFTGIRMALEKDKSIHPEANPVIRAARRLLPVTTELRGHSLLVREQGTLKMTPLMIVLLTLETTDLLFAIDSVPAVFAVTSEPLVVFTSNIFAVLGLRAMYFLLSGAMGRFHALKYGLAFVLVFVGLKMVWLDELAGGRFPIGVSLAVISGAIGASIALSLLFPKEGRRPNWKQIVRRAAGAGCLLLGTLSLLAAGPGRSLIPAADAIRVQWLCVSGLCYFACGFVLGRPGGSGRRW